MKKIAICYQNGCVGGTTTSLISLLNYLDYSKVSVTLYLYNNEGPFIDSFNKNVQVSFVGKKINKFFAVIYSVFSLKLFLLFFSSIFKKNFLRRMRVGLSQIGGQFRAMVCDKKSNEHYDLAIGFMEYWASEYLRFLDADKKISIIHPNYASAFFSLLLDKKLFKTLDNICFVSKTNVEQFNHITRDKFSQKTLWFPNLLDEETIVTLSKEPTNLYFNHKGCVLATCSRIDYFGKGFDRIIEVAAILKKRKFAFDWIIVGGGGEIELLKKRLHSMELDNYFIITGEQTNPFKFIALCDIFVLLSRREGKPMTISEALLLGKRVVCTDYESVFEQIKNGDFGTIISNENFTCDEAADAIIQSFQKSIMCNDILENAFSQSEEQEAIYEIIYD